MFINRQQIIVALLLLWFCLTGSFVGWLNPWLVILNLLIWCVLLLLLAKSEPGGSLTLAILIIIAATLLSTAVNRSWHGFTTAAVWLGYLAVYRLGRHWPVHRSALLALAIYFSLMILLNYNSNIEAANLVGLTLLSLPAMGVFGVYLIGLLALVLLSTGSVGALLALAAALVVYLLRSTPASKPVRYGLCIPLVIIPLIFIEPASAAWRLQFWSDAWRLFASSPLVGVGPGNYHSRLWFHAHNVLFSAAAETGLIGLAALGFLIWSIWRNWPMLPTWAAALVAAFGVWSLVDEPLRFWGVGMMAMLALGRIDQRDKFY